MDYVVHRKYQRWKWFLSGREEIVSWRSFIFLECHYLMLDGKSRMPLRPHFAAFISLLRGFPRSSFLFRLNISQVQRAPCLADSIRRYKRSDRQNLLGSTATLDRHYNCATTDRVLIRPAKPARKIESKLNRGPTDDAVWTPGPTITPNCHFVPLHYSARRSAHSGRFHPNGPMYPSSRRHVQ